MGVEIGEAVRGAHRTQEPIRLSARAEGQQVVVEPENQDKFVLSAQEAAIACQRHPEMKAFQEQFVELLNRLGLWLHRNPTDVDHAYVTIRDGALLFLIIRKTVPFNRGLEDQLTDLDLAIASDGGLGLIELNVLALPKTSTESYRTFLVPGQTWAYVAE